MMVLSIACVDNPLAIGLTLAIGLKSVGNEGPKGFGENMAIHSV